jgi:branched-chain amino acid transport system ATP-binding protein
MTGHNTLTAMPAASAPPLLSTQQLSKSFGGLRAVRDVSLDLSAGELHAVIGPNGAGKSTLVNLLSGELVPSSGRILLDGQDITGARASAMTRLGLGRSFQRTNIFTSLTVLENVRLAAQAVDLTPRRLMKPAVREQGLIDKAMEVLGRTGLGWAGQQTAGTLSHGAQRQLEIAMTLACDPKVLLLDEPMAGMGPEESARIAELLRGLARAHAILLIEHDMDFVFAVADRITVMVEGQVLASGSPGEIRASTAVRNAYLGDHA